MLEGTEKLLTTRLAVMFTEREVCSKKINSANWSSTEWVRVAVKNRSCSIGGVRDAANRAERVITTVKARAALQ